jgi:hypothetical protein
MPAPCTAGRKICQDVSAQRGLCSQGGAPHAVVGVPATQGGLIAALHAGSIGGKHGESEAASEASVQLPALELEGSGERKSIKSDRGGTAGAAEKGARARLPSSVRTRGEKEACRASAWAWAKCWETPRCTSRMTSMVSGLASWSSGGHRLMAVLCRVSHSGQSCSRLGPLKGQTAAGPVRIASWVVAAAPRRSRPLQDRCTPGQDRHGGGGIGWSGGRLRRDGR